MDDIVIAYWRARAELAERRLDAAQRSIARLERVALNADWALDNYREETRRRRDSDIGFMGGGG
jgi:hypothetical protein